MLKKLLIILFLTPNLLLADYQVTGPIIGNVCSFGLICSFEDLHAVKKDGKYYSIQQSYSRVSEYRDGRCWVNIKSKDWGVFSHGLNLFKGAFYQKQSNGSFKKLKPEYITFPCRRY